MTSRVENGAAKQIKKPLPRIPLKPSSVIQGRKIELIEDISIMTKDKEDLIRDIATIESTLKQNYGVSNMERLFVIPSSSWNRNQKLTEDNLPEGTIEIPLAPLRDGSKVRVVGRGKDLYNIYSSSLEAVAKLECMEKKIGDEIDKIEIYEQKSVQRRTVITLLAKSVFCVDEKEIVESVSISDIDKIRVDFNKRKCLIIDHWGMKSVIIPFLKTHDIKTVDLRIFKKEINDYALSVLFSEIQDTKVERVILSKERKETMTEDDLKLIKLTKEALKSRNFKIDLG